MNPASVVAQKILDEIWTPGGGKMNTSFPPPAETPDTVHRDRLQRAVEALMGEGLRFTDRRIELLICDADDRAERFLSKYPSGQELWNVIVAIWEEDHSYVYGF